MIELLPTHNLLLWTSGCLTLLFLLMTGVIIHLYRKVTGDRKRIAALDQALQTARSEITTLSETQREQVRFRETLAPAEITTELQKPRLQLTGKKIPNIPEKYRYFISMAASGISQEEIADILSISTAEARQLVKLSEIAACRM